MINTSMAIRRFLKRMRREKKKQRPSVSFEVPAQQRGPNTDRDLRTPMQKAMEWSYMRKARRRAKRGLIPTADFDRLMERFE